MMDFQIKRSGRRCHATERELSAGEEFVSELVAERGEVNRYDYCLDAWQGPSGESIGWWRARVPRNDGGKVYWAPRDVLVSYFETIQGNEPLQSTAYVMALVLIRKRILQLVDSEGEGASEVLELRYPREKKTWKVPVVELTDSQIREIQQELSEQLFMDQPPE